MSSYRIIKDGRSYGIYEVEFNRAGDLKDVPIYPVSLEAESEDELLEMLADIYDGIKNNEVIEDVKFQEEDDDPILDEDVLDRFK